MLAKLPAGSPVMAGGGQQVAQSDICSFGTCTDQERLAFYYDRNATLVAQGEERRLRPIVVGFAGGCGIFFNRPALQAMEEEIDAGRCVDAPFGDLAVAACARIARVRLVSLPGGWLVNQYKSKGVESFAGEIISCHRLQPERALCWAEHSECDPRCNVTGPMTPSRLTYHSKPLKRTKMGTTGLNSTEPFETTPKRTKMRTIGLNSTVHARASRRPSYNKSVTHVVRGRGQRFERVEP